MASNLASEFQEYLQRALGLPVVLEEEVESGIPFYLLDRYQIRKVEILGKPCVLFMPREHEAPSPAVLRKDGQRMQEILQRVPIWVSLQIDATDRQRLIQHRLPFVLPGFQAYLPDAREHFQRLRTNQRPERFTPSAQRILLEAFYRRDREINQLMRHADARYSPMTKSRVISELESAGLIETERQGRVRGAFIKMPWEIFWEKVHTLMCSPVKRRIYLTEEAAEEVEHLPRAGLSALAELSMLSAPRLPVYATAPRFSLARPESWRRFVTERKDDARAELELWAYSPLKEKQPAVTVDRLSLYLSLGKNEDSRTQDALQQLLKETL